MAYISIVKKLLAFVLIAALGRSSAAQAPGTIIGDVVTRETGAPLDHSMISLISAGRQTFSNDAGRFAFAQLAPGNYRIRVAHLGFTPIDTSFVIPESGPAPRLKVMLTRLSVRLVAVQVVAKPSCTNPGRPDPVLQADFSAVVQQIRLNAEQYQLLSDSCPFAYSLQKERLFGVEMAILVENTQQWFVRVRLDTFCWITHDTAFIFNCQPLIKRRYIISFHG